MCRAGVSPLAGAAAIWNCAAIMIGNMLTLLGGLGLFLFGMQTMTEALRALASTRARQVLAGFTRTPMSGAVTGALTTAVIQSSSATMVTTVGFVGAGMLGFGQALGILYGASVGTTITGWMVLLLGVKLQLSVAALPVLFLAALARVVLRGQAARAAGAAVGLALVFLGIGLMQEGLAQWEDGLRPSALPDAAGLVGLLQLAGIGIAVTLVTQSSSAGVAGALVLLGAGALDFGQAAALVAGMHVGTSFTAVLAAVGGTHAVRQTALANVLYHMVTGALGLALVELAGSLPVADAQVRLLVFHTGFNLLGTLLMLPLTARFAALVERLVPAPADTPDLALLDPSLLGDAGAALDTSAAVLIRARARLFAALADALEAGPPPGQQQPEPAAARAALAPVLDDLQGYLERIAIAPDRTADLARLQALTLHLDHLRRLHARAGQGARLRALCQDPRLVRYRALVAASLRATASPEAGLRPTPEALVRQARAQARLVRVIARLGRMEGQVRHAVMRHAPHVLGLTPAGVFRLSDAIRWLRRSAGHAERLLGHEAEAAAALPALAAGSTTP